MTNKRFHRDEYPFDILGEFGLTENMIYDLPNYVHENIEMGGMSPLLPISIKQPFGCTHCYAKFCLIEVEDGVDVLFSPKLKEADLSNFLKQDRQLLLEGKTIVSEVEEAVLLDVNPAKRNVLDLKNETCKNREKRNVLKISHTRHFKATKKQSKTGCFYSF